ncbi:hypothetical protein [Lentibacillus saliphilus]|uniref:hypothetical protein n=1 Tax=Lentibacillus saliphilus TaxID=2737028 RepID=UPI001C309CBA|nr:hypothetical protein [Lentibacillus saliphilus]
MYKQHVQNLASIDGAIKLVQLDLRRYVSTQQENNEYIYTKILSYLVTCWTEVRVLKLAYEPNGFTEVEIAQIISASTLKDKWLKALNISVCKAYQLNFTDDIEEIKNKLDYTPRMRYTELVKLIEKDLMLSIEIRNRIAHGQWVYAFTNTLENISSDLTGELRTENIVKLQLRIKLFISISIIIHDLAVSPPTFEQNFDKNFKKVEQQVKNLHKRSYEDYKDRMIQKYRRGIQKRRNLLNGL